jgi:hypothetical protein
MPKKLKDRLVVVTSCLGNSAARDTDINSLFFQKRDLSVLCGFASSMFVIVDRLRLFSMRSCPERMPSCRPKVKGGRMGHNLSVRDMIEPMIRPPDDLLYYPRKRSNLAPSGNVPGSQDFHLFDGKGNSK